MLDLLIRPLRDEDVAGVVELSLLAWAPVFASLERILGPEIFALDTPDWRASQRAAVEAVCRARAKYTVLIAERQGMVAGFLAYTLHEADRLGVVEYLAVHPAHQNLGIGTELNHVALAEMHARGMRMAMVETGGDPSHAPARRSYEKAGYTPLPVVRYFKAL